MVRYIGERARYRRVASNNVLIVLIGPLVVFQTVGVLDVPYASTYGHVPVADIMYVSPGPMYMHTHMPQK